MLTIKDVRFKYKKESPWALSDIALAIRPGEKVLIVGKNGAGKTTLSKIMCGLLPGVETQNGYLDGCVQYGGKLISSYSRREIITAIAILFQDFESQIVSSSVMEEMLFYAQNAGMDFTEATQRAKAVADRFGIAHLLSRDVGELSGGEKQKIALFSLLTVDPALLILDEPFTDIEPSSQQYILEFINGELFKGALVLFEQSLDCFRYFTRIVVLRDGAIAYDGGPDVAADERLLSSAGLDIPEMCGIFPSAAVTVLQPAEIPEHRRFDAQAYASIVGEAKMAPGKPIIEARTVRFSYPGNKKAIIDGVDLTVYSGDFIAVLGANGCGKTTLMKLLAGIVRPGGGQVIYKGVPVKAGDIGYVYQNPDSQIFAETVFDEVAFALRMKKSAEGRIRERVQSVLIAMGLADKAAIDPFSLSKGDRQKIACASILVAQPEVLILDEPTTGLDFPSLCEMMGIIKGLNGQGKTILMITHSIRAAAAFARTVLSLDCGKVNYYGPLREFFRTDDLLSAAHAARTDIMDLSMKINGNIVLTQEEFSRCWKERPTDVS